MMSVDEFAELLDFAPHWYRASESADRLRTAYAAAIAENERVSAERDELRNNLHATRHQLLISAERGVQLQAELAAANGAH